MKANKFKVIGLVATGLGMLLTFVSDWANEKQQEADIDEMITRKLQERNE